MIAFLFLVGLALLIGGAELLVRGASGFARAAGVSPLVIGLTVVAYGTSSPELAVSVRAALAGQADLSVGNVVGSNIFNVLFILGICAAICPIVVSRQLVRWDVPVMIGVSVLMYLLGRDLVISRLDGLLLGGAAIAYTWWSIHQGRKESRQSAEGPANEPGAHGPPVDRRWFIHIAFIAVGLAMLVLGSKWLVNGAVSLARFLDVSERLIGLTIVAVGTSLPEVATSIVASVRGERDIAVGNVVGSNIFNILAVLGAAAVVGPRGISVGPVALALDVPMMIAVALACLPIFFTGYKIARWEGFLFLIYYVAYTVYLILNATRSEMLLPYRWAMLGFVLPLTVITLAVTSIRSLRAAQ